FLMATLSVTVNARKYSAEIEPRMLLVHFLRDTLDLTGTHVGCVVGRCGACTVLWKNKAVKACMVLAIETHDSEITTIEGLSADDSLHPLQEAFLEADAVECGYCTPGMVMAAYALLRKIPMPSAEEIKRAISGNLCRCTGYMNIVKAIQAASGKRQEI
ncbi:MAG TPA: (2Fe-2S)-binding protein, partial [Terriglobales bacterium]|nr:(2Fe-2S)-binding protein [Terriglobales bacterium]